MSLTAKQQAFVREYLVDSNATQAAIRAGYSAKTAQEQGSRLLSKVMVMKAVNEATGKIVADVAEAVVVSRTFVLKGLIDEAKGVKKPGAAKDRIAALKLLGQTKALFIKRELKEDDKSLEEILAEADRLEAEEERDE